MHTGGKPGDENNRTVSWESMSDCHWTDRAHIDYMGEPDQAQRQPAQHKQ
eukprot:SAG11_NODE_3434_length_2450_cov_1.447044_2_plen_50_part_00